MQDFGYWRFRLKRYWAGAEYCFAPLFQEIAKRIGEDLNTLMWVYNYQDVRRSLLKNTKLPRNTVKIRKNSFTYVLQNAKLVLLTGKKERTFLKQYIDKLYAKNTTELKGNIANKGYAKGKVRIVHVSDTKQFERDVKKFKKGDILVATMTQINAVVLMKKAGAILTEQGGVTSHAAIISREINKPCIVGVEHLTGTLKDGDLVEVDAEKGVINKIN